MVSLRLDEVSKKLPQYKANKPLDLQGTINRATNNTNLGQSKLPTTSSTPSAVVPQQTPIQPAQSTPKITSPAGQQYMSSLSGLKEQALGLQSQVQDLKKTENNDSEYLKYIRSIFNPNEAKTQADAYQKSQQRLADIQSERERAELEARKGYMKTLDTPGGLKSGTQAGAGVYNRRSSDDLADIALQESAAARSAGVAQNSYATYLEQIKEANTPLTFEEAQALGVPIGTTVMEARQQGLIPEKAAPEGFSLSEGQARYDAQGNIIASRGKTYAPGTGTSGTGGLVDANGKPIKLAVGQVETLSGFDNTEDSANKAIALLDGGVATGPLEGRLLQAKKFGGGGDPKQLELEQVLGKLRADFMKAISGAAVSDSEVIRLAKFLPDINDQENVIKSKLATLISETANAKANYLRTLGASGGMSEVTNDAQPPQMELNGQILYLQPDGTYE